MGTLAHPYLEEHPRPALAKIKGRYLAKYRRPPLKMGPLHSSPTHPNPTQPNSPNLNPTHPLLNVHLFLHLAKIMRRYLAKYRRQEGPPGHPNPTPANPTQPQTIPP